MGVEMDQVRGWDGDVTLGPEIIDFSPRGQHFDASGSLAPQKCDNGRERGI